MNKKLIAAAIAASVAAPAAFADNVTVYGKVRQAVQDYDRGTTDMIEIVDMASRLGFTGSEDLGNGLKAVWKMEFGVDISDSSGATDEDEFSGDTFSARNAFVGLAGDFGTVVIGRHDTPLKLSTGALDYFGDTTADNNSRWTEDLQDRRADGTLAYISPTFNGLHAAVALVPGENTLADGLADAYSAAVIYSNNGIHASIAYEAGDKDITNLTTGDATVGDLAQWRAGLGYSGNNFKVGVVYEDQEIENASGGADIADIERLVVAASYTMGNNVIKAKYFDVDVNNTSAGVRSALSVDDDHDGFAIGVEHNFSKRTQAQLVYVDSDSSTSSEDTDVLSLQLNHSF
jgi:predicted porin